MKPRTLLPFVALTCATLLCARADQEGGNTVYVQSADFGSCYAKSIPAETYGTKGTTKIYIVQEKDDKLVDTYDWYSRPIALQGTAKGISVVRFGPWTRGNKASPDDLAIAFYLNGKLLKQFSTLDIAGAPDNVSQSISHYTVIQHRPGYRRLDGNDYAFDIETTDGRKLSFNPDTGEQLLLPPKLPG